MRLVKGTGEETAKQMDAEALKLELMQLAQTADGKRMLDLLEQMKAESAQAPQAPRLSNVEVMMQAFRDAHTEDECKLAMEFVCRAFADCIQEEAAGPNIIWARIVASKETRKMGIVNPSVKNGWMEHRGLRAEYASLYYIEAILKGLKEGKTDEEVVWDMIEYSKSDPFGTGAAMLHPGFLFLIVGEDGEIGGKDGQGKLELWTHYIGFDDEDLVNTH